MATEKLNLSELKKMIISEAEKIMSLGDPLSVDMNKMTNPGNSTGDALVMTKGTGGFVKKSAAPDAAENIDDTEEPLEVDMNEMDGDQGHDEQIAAAVKVSAAGSTKKGASVEGMKNSNFESKDKNPSTASSAPFEEREDKVEMNSQDKADAGGAKTYVEPGAELHKGASTGQHAAKFSEKAQNERETAERIAQGIQLPENFKNKADLLNFINEEAKKLSDTLLEGEKKTINDPKSFFKKFINKKENINEGFLDNVAASIKGKSEQGKLAQELLAKFGITKNPAEVFSIGMEGGGAGPFENEVQGFIKSGGDVNTKIPFPLGTKISAGGAIFKETYTFDFSKDVPTMKSSGRFIWNIKGGKWEKFDVQDGNENQEEPMNVEAMKREQDAELGTYAIEAKMMTIADAAKVWPGGYGEVLRNIISQGA